MKNAEKQQSFYDELRNLEDTGTIGGKRYPLSVYHELFEFAQCTAPFTTVTRTTAHLLGIYGFPVRPHGIGWVVGKHP